MGLKDFFLKLSKAFLRIKQIIFSKAFFLLFLVILFTGLVFLPIPVKDKFLKPKLLPSPGVELNTQEAQPVSESTTDSYGNVRTNPYQVPQIYISGGEQGYSSGGMIALASTDEPAVVIGGYNVTGDAQIDMYEADEPGLLDYLTHDKDGKQTKSKPDLAKLRFITNVKHAVDTSSYQGSKIPLPLGETGIWYLKVKMGTINADAYIIRSNIGIVTKEGDNELIYWGQNFKTKRSISDGTVKLLDMTDPQKELQLVSFNAEGLARTNLLQEADIALVSQGSDRAIIPLNLKYLNTGYNYKQFGPKSPLTRYFVFTDRPLYKPGDVVNFKTVLRDDDDGRYTIPGDEATVKIFNGYYYEGSTEQPVFEKNYPVSEDGTINGQYKIPLEGSVGNYNIYITVPSAKRITSYWDSEYASNSVSFDVQFFRKPEFSIDVTLPQAEVIAGDGASFKITGNYFSGQPLTGQTVKYKVSAANFYEYQYFSDIENSGDLSDEYRYGYSYESNEVASGTASLDQNGEAEISLDTKLKYGDGKTQVFSIEATIDDGSLEPSFSRRNMLVFAGEYGIYRTDTLYGSKVNTPLSLPVVLKPYRNNFNLSGVKLSAKVHRENWIEFQEPNQKYPSYKREEEELPDLDVLSDSQGKAEFRFSPKKVGSYKFTVEGKDGRGNLISKVFYAYVSADDQPYYTQYGNNNLTIAADKQKYSPTDTVHFSIFSQIPDRDILLSLERGRVNRFQIVRLNGKTGSIDVPLVNTDIPNMYADVSSFSSSALDSNETDVILSSTSKKLFVNITPQDTTFGPGEEVSVNVSTTDSGGNPVAADLALWTVDKAIFELSDNKLGDIFDTFWHKRFNSTQSAHSLEGILVNQAEGGGCFARDTQILMADGKTKNIEEVRVGDYVLTRSEKDANLVNAKVLGNHEADAGGYLILNGDLKVTANHILRVNNKWMEAGSAQIGDEFTDNVGSQVKISSIEWQRGKFKVYNLEVEKYHTYFAGGVWVHNQKGIVRNAFKDTAYWNPSLHTDASGRAQISFKLPDNLTTWTIAAVGSTADTKVGQTTSEIVVTKDVAVRPVLPNIMRTGDEIVLSAIVQNFTNEDQTFDVDLNFDSGEVEDALKSDVVIKSKGRQQFYWKTKVTKENDKSKLV
ncbi:hypothetical protein HYW44_02595 [Candidatus Daviesbacteria bacterium]|nr:hypothetical protein [Candidatus Daviesbacteria bacterium]